MALMILTSQFLGIAPFNNPSNFWDHFSQASDEAFLFKSKQLAAHVILQCVIIRIKSNLSKIFLTNCSSYVSVG